MEIINDTDGNFQYFVSAVGTGGTICGCARRFKDENIATQIVGVDPEGSALAPGFEERGPFLTEGIGQKDFIPRCLDRSLIDTWVKISDRESFAMARRLIAEEGLMIGGSAGAAVAGAIKAAKEHSWPADARIVIICPDGIGTYISTFVNPSWLVDMGYTDPEPNFASGNRIGDVVTTLSIPAATTILDTAPLS